MMITYKLRPLFLMVFLLPAIVCAADTLSVMRVFHQLQGKTGLWHIDLVIRERGGELRFDKSGKIIVPEDIITLCYKDHTQEQGDDRLAFLLSHEMAHCANNDYLDEFYLNPFDKNLSGEKSEERRKKEINADMGAVSLMMAGGFSIRQFENKKDNIINDIYRYYRIDPGKPNKVYPSAAERIKIISDRKKILLEYNRLYECGNYLLLYSDLFSSQQVLDIAIDAFNHYLSHCRIETPELLSNIGMCYLKKAKLAYSEEFLPEPDTAGFMKFESGYVMNTESFTLRGGQAANAQNAMRPAALRRVEYEKFRDAAYRFFGQADVNSLRKYLPSRLNQVILLSLDRKYEDASRLLDEIYENHLQELKKYSLLPYYYNLKAINMYCLGKKGDADQYFDMSAGLGGDFTTGLKNKAIARNRILRQENDKPKEGELSPDELYRWAEETLKTGRSSTKEPYFFGFRDKFRLLWAESNSVKSICIDEQETGRKIEFNIIKNGGFKNSPVNTGSARESVLSRMPDNYSISFSLSKSFYNFVKYGIILAFNGRDMLEEIICTDTEGISDREGNF